MVESGLTYLPELCKPNRVATAPRILNGMFDDTEAVRGEKGEVLGAVQACVIQRLALERAHCYTVIRPACEHQGCPGSRMHPEDWEHPTLIVRTQVEKLSQAMMPSKV